MAGLDIASAQQSIYDFIEDNAPAGYVVFEGDLDDAYTIAATDGIKAITWYVQFSDLYPASRDNSFGGPQWDGYYSIFRVYTVAPSAKQARQGQGVINQLILGRTFPNVSAISKEFGGGAFILGEALSRPLAFVGPAAFQFRTNIENVSTTVYPE